MKILHFSDFHFGNSIKQDSIYSTIEEDFIYKTLKYIKTEIEKIDLVIFTGDLVFKGKTSDLNNPTILDFIDQFKKIPILICNGNHELIRENIEKKIQFKDFSDFIKKHRKKYRIKLSKKFNENQASFIEFPIHNMVFFSLNSCQNIISNKEKDYKNLATLPYKSTDEFFIEVRKRIKYFDYRNKFVILHHPLEKLKDHLNAIKILKENDIKIVFAGDSHRFSKTEQNGIIGFTAGTLFGSNSIKWDQLNLIMEPNQFNYYDLNLDKNTILVSQFIYNDEQLDWCLKHKLSTEIELIKGWNLENWCKYFGIIQIYDKLEEKSINFIFKNISLETDYIGFTKKLEEIKIFYFENEDQKKVRLIKTLIRKQKLNKEVTTNILIIDKTRKLKGQISTQNIIEV